MRSKCVMPHPSQRFNRPWSVPEQGGEHGEEFGASAYRSFGPYKVIFSFRTTVCTNRLLLMVIAMFKQIDFSPDDIAVSVPHIEWDGEGTAVIGWPFTRRDNIAYDNYHPKRAYFTCLQAIVVNNRSINSGLAPAPPRTPKGSEF